MSQMPPPMQRRYMFNQRLINVCTCLNKDPYNLRCLFAAAIESGFRKGENSRGRPRIYVIFFVKRKFYDLLETKFARQHQWVSLLCHQAVRFGSSRRRKYIFFRAGAEPDKPDDTKVTPLMLACKFGFEQVIKFLLTKKINVNALSSRGIFTFPETPLSIAQQKDIVNCTDLIEAGANVNQTLD